MDQYLNKLFKSLGCSCPKFISKLLSFLIRVVLESLSVLTGWRAGNTLDSLPAHHRHIHSLLEKLGDFKSLAYERKPEHPMGENPHRNGENMPTPHRKEPGYPRYVSNPCPSYATYFTTVPPCN